MGPPILPDPVHTYKQYIYLYIHIYIYIHVCISLYIYLYVYIYIFVYVSLCIYTYHVYYISMYIYIHIYIYIWVFPKQTCSPLRARTSTHLCELPRIVFSVRSCSNSYEMHHCVCVCVCGCVCFLPYGFEQHFNLCSNPCGGKGTQ